jgi:hypothetical protein
MRNTQHFDWRRAVASMAITLVLAATSAAQGDAPPAAIKGAGSVRVCEANGDNVDSDGNQYGAEGFGFLSGPPPNFDKSYACRGRPQKFSVFQTADPDGDEKFGFRMVSQISIDVDFQPEDTDVLGQSGLQQQVCLIGPGTTPNSPLLPKLTVLARAKASRSITSKNCLDDNGGGPTSGPCSSSRGRFGGFGDDGFTDKNGHVIVPGVFIDLTDPLLKDPQGWIRLTKVGRLVHGLGETYLLGGMTGMLMTSVAGAPSGTATGDLRFWLEADKDTINMVECTPTFPTGADAAARVILPKPAWWIDEGDAIPDDFTLAISPPTGPMTLAQQFDLSIMAATGGAAMTGISGTIDGLDVSGPLAACLQPTAALSGVQGGILTCRGLSGGFLAGIFGVGAHTMNVSMALSDGRVITDSATWTIHP